MTDTQIKIDNQWYLKKAIIPSEKLIASRFKRILEKPINITTAEDIRYLRQIEHKVFKPIAMRSVELNKVINRITGKSLRDDAHFANSVQFKIKQFQKYKTEQLTNLYEPISGISRGMYSAARCFYLPKKVNEINSYMENASDIEKIAEIEKDALAKYIFKTKKELHHTITTLYRSHEIEKRKQRIHELKQGKSISKVNERER